MSLQSASKIPREPDIIEFVLSIEGINPLTSPDIAPDHILIFAQGLMGNVFQVLADQLSLPCRNGFLLRLCPLLSQIRGDFGELGEGGFEVFDDLGGDDVGRWEIGGIL